jgi:hypothetical protein
METLEEEQRLTTALAAANRYLTDGGNPASLSLSSAAQRGLFPTEWTIWQEESGYPWLRGETDGTVQRRFDRNLPGCVPLIERYGHLAKRTFFLRPYKLRQDIGALRDVTDPHWLVITFDCADSIAAAIALAGNQS